MEQLLYVDFKSLRDNEALGFFQQIAEKSKLVTVQADQAVIKAFGDATTSYDKATKQTPANSYTEARAQADALTDHYCVGIRKYADAQTYSPNEEEVTVAKKTVAIIEKYGYLTKLSYKEQYPAITKLLNDLEALTEAEKKKLRLDPWIKALQEAHDTFCSITAEKVNEESEKQVGIIKETRTVAQEAYTAMYNRLNAGAEYIGDTAYLDFFAKANVIIEEYNTLLASRKTRAKNKKAEENEQE